MNKAETKRMNRQKKYTPNTNKPGIEGKSKYAKKQPDRKPLKITGAAMVKARANAGHTLNQCSVFMDVSVNLIVNLEQRDELPKSTHILSALATYITNNKESK